MTYFINSILIISFITHGMLKSQDDLPAQINALEIQRTYAKDIRGYSQEEIDAAKNVLQKTLYPKRNKLNEKIKLFEEKRLQATDKGILWSSPKAELKQQYDAANAALKKAETELHKLNEQIKNQEIIAGQRSSALVRGAKYAMAGAALAGIAALGASYYWSYEISKIRAGVYEEGGWKLYLRNHLFGEPYKIKQPNELQVWDNTTKEWKPVIGNEELAKHAPLTIMDGTFGWHYDEYHNMVSPNRGKFVFWDEKMGVYRQVTRAEANDYLFSKLFLWPKDPNLWPKYK